ncbi:MAG: hypothetical protein GF328_14960 [Candidatus Latescibacteria bacterium]|nr:hypothetical protein [Candidatus Latescibacterota bacterium]
MTRLSAVSLAAVLAVLVPASRAPAQESETERTSRLVDEIKREVEEQRGLEFKEDFDRRVFSPEDIRKMALEKMERDLPEETLRQISSLYARVGFFPLDLDLLSAFADLLESGAAGFYDPDEKVLYVLRGFSPRGARPIIFHELIHALEDQYFDLGALLRETLEVTDRGLAIRAVVEGSATYYMQRYMQERPELMLALMKDVAKTMAEQREAMNRIPVAISVEMGIFPYAEGLKFVTGTTRGEAEGIAGLYGDLPVSTEQVLHPEKYRKDGDFPYEIELGDLSEALPPGWSPSRRDRLGELLIGVLLNEFEGGANDRKLARITAPMMSGMKFRGTTKAASEGWDGDLLAGFEGPGGATAFLWASRWDSEEDAREFATAYKQGLSYKWETLDLSPETAQVEVRGDRVLIVEGFPAEAMYRIVAAAWDGLTFRPDPRDRDDQEARSARLRERLEREILELRREIREQREARERLEPPR